MADKQNKNENLENSKTIKSKTSKRKKQKVTKKYLKERYRTQKKEHKDFVAYASNVVSSYKKFIDNLLICIVYLYVPKTEEEKMEYCFTYKFNKKTLESYLNGVIEKYSLNISNLNQNGNKTDIDDKTNIDDKTYKVGYKNPPIETRFQKGDKGNPKGRKRKKDEEMLDLIEKKLQEPITVTKNGKTMRVPKKEIVTEQITKSLLNGTPIPKNNIDLVKYMDRYSNNKKSLNEIFGKNRS